MGIKRVIKKLIEKYKAYKQEQAAYKAKEEKWDAEDRERGEIRKIHVPEDIIKDFEEANESLFCERTETVFTPDGELWYTFNITGRGCSVIDNVIYMIYKNMQNGVPYDQVINHLRNMKNAKKPRTSPLSPAIMEMAKKELEDGEKKAEEAFINRMREE